MENQLIQEHDEMEAKQSNGERKNHYQMHKAIVKQTSSEWQNQRVILNVGGTRFETYISTLTQYPNTLLGAMFHERNAHLRKPDSMGEYFFDRSPKHFEYILNFYRTGILEIPNNINSRRSFEADIEFWQIPLNQLDELEGEQKIGDRLAQLSLEKQRIKSSAMLSRIKKVVLDSVEEAASNGIDEVTIEFKESHAEFYAFLSNFSQRELLLHDLREDNFNVFFNDFSSGQGHSYVLSITLWNRYSRQHQFADITKTLVYIYFFFWEIQNANLL